MKWIVTTHLHGTPSCLMPRPVVSNHRTEKAARKAAQQASRPGYVWQSDIHWEDDGDRGFATRYIGGVEEERTGEA